MNPTTRTNLAIWKQHQAHQAKQCHANIRNVKQDFINTFTILFYPAYSSLEQILICCLREKSIKQQIDKRFFNIMKLPLNSKFFISCLLNINHYLLINSLAEFKALPVLVFGNRTVIEQERKKPQSVTYLCSLHVSKPASVTWWSQFRDKSTQDLSSSHTTTSNMKETATQLGDIILSLGEKQGHLVFKLKTMFLYCGA